MLAEGTMNCVEISNEQLVARIQAGVDTADDMLRLWQQTRDFITLLAKKYSAYAEMEDLQQEGYLALCDAVGKYEPDRGVTFINYAAYWIGKRSRAGSAGILMLGNVGVILERHYAFQNTQRVQNL